MIMAPKLPPKPQREQARVLYPYTAQNDDELTIKEGDIITILSKENEDVGWWKGELNGRVALFPDNFVEIIKQPLPSPSSAPEIESLSSITSSSSKFSLNRMKKPDRTTSNNSNQPLTTNNVSLTNNNPVSSSTPLSENSSTTQTSLTNKSSQNKSTKFQLSNNSISDMDEDQMIKDENHGLFNNNNGNNIVITSISNPESNNNNNNNNNNSSSKLFHPTKERPKIPSNCRRPPSLYFSKDFDPTIMNDHDEENGFGDNLSVSTPDSPRIANGETNIETGTNSIVKQSSTTLQPDGSTTISTSNNTNKVLPWMIELQKAQEAKRQRNININKHSDSNLLDSSSTLSSSIKNETISPLQAILNKSPSTTTTTNNQPPTIVTSKPFVSKNSKPSLSQSFSERSNESSRSASNDNSGTNKMYSSLRSTNDNVSGSVSGSTNSPGSINNITNNQTKPTATAAITTTSDHTATVQTITRLPYSNVHTSPTATNLQPTSSSLHSKQQEELKKEMQDIRTRLNEIDSKFDMFIKQQQSSMDKMQTTIKELMENERKSKSLVKELINEWADQKKEMAIIRIELDRLKKLNTTIC